MPWTAKISDLQYDLLVDQLANVFVGDIKFTHSFTNLCGGGFKAYKIWFYLLTSSSITFKYFLISECNMFPYLIRLDLKKIIFL